MKKISLAIVAVAMVCAATSVYAGNSGVGFGTALFGNKQGKVWEVLAVTTNGTSGSSTFAITSGTSGYKEGITVGMNDVEIYVAKNMDSLATDIARGDGEYVNTLAMMLEVKDVNSFKSKLKVNFDKIYPTTGVTSKQVVANINDVTNS